MTEIRFYQKKFKPTIWEKDAVYFIKSAKYSDKIDLAVTNEYGVPFYMDAVTTETIAMLLSDYYTKLEITDLFTNLNLEDVTKDGKGTTTQPIRINGGKKDVLIENGIISVIEVATKDFTKFHHDKIEVKRGNRNYTLEFPSMDGVLATTTSIYDEVYDSVSDIYALTPSNHIGKTYWARDTKQAYFPSINKNTNQYVWQGLYPVYDTNNHGHYIPHTPEGHTVSLGREIFFTAESIATKDVDSYEPALFIVTQVAGLSNHKKVELCSVDDMHSEAIYGINTTDALIGKPTNIVTYGEIRGVNTSKWVEGATLYASATAGELTSVKPTSKIFPIATVEKSDASGILFVNTLNTNSEFVETVSISSDKTWLTGQASDIAGNLLAAPNSGTVVAFSMSMQSSGVLNSIIWASRNHLTDKLTPFIMPSEELTGTIDFAFQNSNFSTAQASATIEVYLADENGNAIDSGTGLVNGSLGVPPIVILKSPEETVDHTNDTNAPKLVNFNLEGVLNQEIAIAQDQRLIYRVGFSTNATGTGTFYFGSAYRSFLHDLLLIKASDIEYDNNQSGLNATNVKQALDELSAKLGTTEYFKFKAASFTTEENGKYVLQRSLNDLEVELHSSPKEGENLIFLVEQLHQGSITKITTTLAHQILLPDGRLVQELTEFDAGDIFELIYDGNNWIFHDFSKPEVEGLYHQKVLNHNSALNILDPVYLDATTNQWEKADLVSGKLAQGIVTGKHNNTGSLNIGISGIFKIKNHPFVVGEIMYLASGGTLNVHPGIIEQALIYVIDDANIMLLNLGSGLPTGQSIKFLVDTVENSRAEVSWADFEAGNFAHDQYFIARSKHTINVPNAGDIPTLNGRKIASGTLLRTLRVAGSPFDAEIVNDTTNHTGELFVKNADYKITERPGSTYLVTNPVTVTPPDTVEDDVFWSFHVQSANSVAFDPSFNFPTGVYTHYQGPTTFKLLHTNGGNWQIIPSMSSRFEAKGRYISPRPEEIGTTYLCNENGTSTGCLYYFT